MRGFEALTWCHDQGRRFGSYHAQAAARPWPRATALWAPERGLLVAGAGAGGGAQQALFREELQAYLQAGLARWPEGSDLGAYFYAVQAAFDAATEPAFAEQLQGTAVAALLTREAVSVGNLGCERAYLLQAGVLRRLTEDDSAARGAPPGPLAGVLRSAPMSWFRQGEAARARPTVRRVPWAEGDLLLLATGLAPALDEAADAALERALVDPHAPLPELIANLVAALLDAAPDEDARDALLGRTALALARAAGP
ncbi:MAG: hypothetical protein KC933_28610 [Myxococcales bacterium]|nr:hypothetical protein [Myxococcales bacterium]MCB9645895.1 hypothetical protein [Deltaproteobacteria bacterium]